LQPTHNDEHPHVPGPSIWPAGFAVGVVVLLVGLIVSWYVVGLGALIALAFGFLWVRDLTTGSSLTEAPAVAPEGGRPESVTGAANPADSVLIARLIISKTGFWTHAVDSAGHVIYHYPSTLGAGYDPSPTGDFKVTGVASDPKFHYQPKLFHEVPDTNPDAHLPPGPNSPVGVVWISLSKPHYGIHGTSSPETIGYVSSHGCVRLTNWDAFKLAEFVEPGTQVVFQ